MSTEPFDELRASFSAAASQANAPGRGAFQARPAPSRASASVPA